MDQAKLNNVKMLLNRAQNALDELTVDDRPDPVVDAAAEAVTEMLRFHMGVTVSTRTLATWLAADGRLQRSASTLQQRILPALAASGFQYAKTSASGRTTWRHPNPVPPGFQRKDQ